MRHKLLARSASLAALTLPSLALSQTLELGPDDGGHNRHESPQNFVVELRFFLW